MAMLEAMLRVSLCSRATFLCISNLRLGKGSPRSGIRDTGHALPLEFGLLYPAWIGQSITLLAAMARNANICTDQL